MVNDARSWDERYAAAEPSPEVEPNLWVREIISPLPPGTALDIAAGAGRNAVWMIEQGWQVTAVDYSAVAIERAEAVAAARLDAAGRRRLTAVVADVVEEPLPGPEVDLVLYCYLQLPPSQMETALMAGLRRLRVGGTGVIVAHSLRNHTEGHGGPTQAEVVYDPHQILELIEQPVIVDRAEIVSRDMPTETGQRYSLDSVVVVRRTE